MPSTIPYSQSLVLGSIVDTRVIGLIDQINAVQGKTDSAQDNMQSLITMKRSLAMTLNELADMGIDISALQEKIKGLDASISQSAQAYLAAKLESEETLQTLKQQLNAGPQSQLTSPVDFTQSKIATLPLSSESIKIDAQYFSFGSNQSDDVLANIEKYVKEATADIGAKSNEVSTAVSRQVSRQSQNHNLSGTLIITATCTHRNVSMLSPLVLQPDSTLAIWNNQFKENRIDIDNIQPMLGKPPGDTVQQELTLLSGVAYGSSFVGMVHLLKTDTSSNAVDDATLAGMRAKMELGGWLQNAAGGIGVDPSILDGVKRLLSTQTFASHISIVAMGTIPSIASGEIKMGLSKILQSEPEQNLSLVAALNQGDEGEDTTATEAAEAKNTARLLNMQQANASAVIKGLSEIDHGTNRMLDINSLMAAFENYIASVTASNGAVGVPISFFYKKIGQQEVLKAVAGKYGKGNTTDQPNEKQSTVDNKEND